MTSDDPDDLDEVTTVAITDELDLHTFRPADCADLVTEYLHAAHAAGFISVRIVHGKGAGTLRRIVHGVLDRHPLVTSYGPAERGSWGATRVELGARSESPTGGGKQ